MDVFCPLCNSQSGSIESVAGPLDRNYFHCFGCDLIFVSPDDLLSVEEEQNRYRKHENSIKDSGYVDFLNLAIEPALPFLNREMKGLDYGSGAGSCLSELLRRKGISCKNYDPFFGPEMPEGIFDFIFSTEVFEHFHYPVKEMKLIEARIKTGGYLVVMSMWHTGTNNFRNWFYARDETHVLFYSLATFEYICRQWNFESLWNDGKRVIILRKSLPGVK